MVINIVVSKLVIQENEWENKGSFTPNMILLQMEKLFFRKVVRIQLKNVSISSNFNEDL